MAYEVSFRTPMIGRDAEFNKVKEKLELSLNKEGQTVFIGGEAGIGKTRLVSEIQKYAREKDVKILTGRCYYQSAVDPYLPFVDALRELFDIHKDDSDEDEGRKILNTIKKASPELVQMIPVIGNIIAAGASLMVSYKSEQETLPKLDPQAERNKMFETISQLLIGVADKEPTILFLDDIHWADESSLKLLHYISRNTKEAPLLILCTYRPEDVEASPQLKDTMQRMSREKLYDEVMLKRLDEKLISKFSAEFYKKEIPEELVKMIYKETEGNPFFTEEILHSLEEQGLISDNIDLSKIQLPTTVTDVIERRLSILTDIDRKVLQYASVIGIKFQFDVLMDIVETSEDELVDVIDGLIKHNLIYELSARDDTYRLAHALIQNVLYQGISGRRIRLLHKKIGDATERINKHDLNDVYAELAYHYTEANDKEKALEYSMLAGDQAAGKYSQKEAIIFYKTAVELLQHSETKTDDDKLAEYLKKLGDAEFIAGAWDSALETFDELKSLAKKINNTKLLAETYLKVGKIHINRQEWDSVDKNINKAIEISKANGYIKILVEANRRLAQREGRHGNFDNAIKFANIALEFAKKTESENDDGVVYTDIGITYTKKGEIEKAIENYKKAIEKLEKGNDLTELSRAHFNLAVSYYFKNDFEGMKRECENAIKLADKVGEIANKGYALMNFAAACVQLNELDKAEKALKDAIKIAKKINSPILIHYCLVQYGMVNHKREDWDKSEKYFEDAIKMVEEKKDKYDIAYSTLRYAQMLRDKGDLEKAKEKYAYALNIAKEINSKKLIEMINSDLEDLS